MFAERSVSFWMKLVYDPELDFDEALWLAVVRVFTTKWTVFFFVLVIGFYISMESNCFCRLLCYRLAMNRGKFSVPLVSDYGCVT